MGTFDCQVIVHHLGTSLQIGIGSGNIKTDRFDLPNIRNAEVFMCQGFDISEPEFFGNIMPSCC